jgi:5-(carboxyamino)imidazole ribonucleotide mutase
MVEYARNAHQQGIKVIIAGAGGAAHLPGMVAALTPLPVIGVPVTTRQLQGVDSLYSIVQMPRGIPVATVAIGNAQNAGLLAVQILATSNPQLQSKIQQYRQDLAQTVLDKQERLDKLGYQTYLSQM